MFWSEMTFKRELKGFEDGLNDARRQAVDPIAYQVNREYRNGVDIAHQLMARFDNPQIGIGARPGAPPNQSGVLH